MKKQCKCIVNKIVYEKGDSLIKITTGVKKAQQYKYEKYYKGGFGTYITDYYNTPSELKAKIYVCEFKRYVFLDIKDSVLKINNRKRITKNLIDLLAEKNEGTRVWLDFEISGNGHLVIENSEENINKLNLAI